MRSEDISTQMRYGLRRLAKAVVVITMQVDGKRHAMAATAVSELSLSPPSMLICVNKSASLYPLLVQGASFGINILHTRHRDVAHASGGGLKGEERFTVGEWGESDLGVPRLKDAQASFICHNKGETQYGSHGIFIGEVTNVFASGDVDPLVYVDGHYASVGDQIV